MNPTVDSPEPNPFATTHFKQVRADQIKKTLTRVGTYFILLCAAIIFANIFMKGVPVLFPGFFEKGKPLMDVSFLTKAPATLVSWEDAEGTVFRLSVDDFNAWRAKNPDAVVRNEHRNSYSGGGVLGPILGTIMLTVICIGIALVVGIAAAIYLSEYSTQGGFMQVIRLAILNLAGVPSIVFGLFGMGFFCLAFPVFTDNLRPHSLFHLQFGENFWLSFQGFDNSLIAGGLTLAVMILPVIITACEESLKAVPMGFREASLALGATKWETIRKSVLPYAFPGMLTASVLGITRVAGETAPIMLTAAVAMKDKMPWEGLGDHFYKSPETAATATEAAAKASFDWGGIPGNFCSAVADFFTQKVQALPYHIYTVSAKIPQSDDTKPMQYGSVFVFMVIVMMMAALSIYLRIKVRRALKW